MKTKDEVVTEESQDLSTIKSPWQVGFVNWYVSYRYFSLSVLNLRAGKGLGREGSLICVRFSWRSSLFFFELFGLRIHFYAGEVRVCWWDRLIWTTHEWEKKRLKEPSSSYFL